MRRGAERGDGKPVALLVDDAHLLDEGSAALTHQLAAGTETFVLVTVRSGELASDAVEGAMTPALTAVTARVALSARELEIARLAAAGVPNKEIGERLFLSRHTVQNKLHAAYEKLGVDGRAELAQALEGY